jgi:flagellar protein FlaG
MIESNSIKINAQNPSLISTRGRNENIPSEKTTDKKLIEETQQTGNQQVITTEKMNNAVDHFNKVFKPTHLEFQLHENSGKYFVQIIDDMSKEVIKQIPSEDFLEMVAQFRAQQGLIIDERV